MDFVPPNIRLTPIGRLDQDTTGLLLLTNDGDLHQYLTHPKNQIPKDYEAVIEGRLTPSQIQKLARGQAEIVNQETKKGRSSLIMRLRHGKKREIRRILYRLKLKLISLKRIRFSNLTLGTLTEGNYRQLTLNEVDSLRN